MGLDQGIRRMSPEIAAKLQKWQEGGQQDEEYLLDSEHDTIERVWEGRKENHIRSAVAFITGREPVNCGYLWLEREHVEKLVNLLSLVDEDHERADILLPTQAGFFFGRTDYDEYYFKVVARELEDFTLILKEWDEDKSYAYWEWW